MIRSLKISIVAGVAILVATSVNASAQTQNPLPDESETVGQEISQLTITKEDSELLKLKQDADTLIKKKFAHALRQPYNPKTIQDNIKEVSEVPAENRSEYYNAIEYYFGPLVKNYKSYNSEVQAIINRWIEIVQNMATQYAYSQDGKFQKGLKEHLLQDINLFKNKGNIMPMGAKQNKLPSLSFEYFKYWKDDYQTIPYLNNLLNETLSTVESFHNALGKSKDIIMVGNTCVDRLKELRKMTQEQIVTEGIDRGNLGTAIAVKQSPDMIIDKPKMTESIPVNIPTNKKENKNQPKSKKEKSEKNGKSEKKETSRKSVLDNLLSVDDIKTQINKLKSDEAKKSELSEYIKESLERFNFVQREYSDQENTLNNSKKNLDEVSPVNRALLQEKVNEAQKKLEEIENEKEALADTLQKLKDFYKNLFNEEYSAD